MAPLTMIMIDYNLGAAASAAIFMHKHTGRPPPKEKYLDWKAQIKLLYKDSQFEHPVRSMKSGEIIIHVVCDTLVQR